MWCQYPVCALKFGRLRVSEVSEIMGHNKILSVKANENSLSSIRAHNMK